MKKQPGAAAQAHNVFLISSLSSLKESTEELQRWAADSETAQPQQHNVQGFYRERWRAASQWLQSVFRGVAHFLSGGPSVQISPQQRAAGTQGLVSAAGPVPPGGVTPAEGWASVVNQEDMADLALVRAPPTD